jgi:hypothetical protein
VSFTLAVEEYEPPPLRPPATVSLTLSSGKLLAGRLRNTLKDTRPDLGSDRLILLNIRWLLRENCDFGLSRTKLRASMNTLEASEGSLKSMVRLNWFDAPPEQ